MPNAATYPWQWLWDSCFHALVWAELEAPERAVTEIERLFTFQTDDGFVPHMNYLTDPEAAIVDWGRRGSSNITQPPMYGHAIADLVRRGLPVPAETVGAAPAKGSYVVQLGSFTSTAGSEQAWARLQKAHPELLGDMSLFVQKALVEDRTYFRVQAGPVPNRATAMDLCAQLKARKQDCLVVRR